MSIDYVVKIDEESLKETISAFEFVGGNIDKAISVAINKTGPKALTMASVAIRAQVNLKAGFIRERLLFKRASPWKLSGAIEAPHRGLLMPRYSTNSTISGSVSGAVGETPKTPTQGIRVKVKTSGTSKIFHGNQETAGNKPFFMILKNSGALGIVARMNELGPRGGKIKAFYGPSLSQVFQTVRGDILPKVADEYQAQLLDAMRYLLVKQYPPEPVP